MRKVLKCVDFYFKKLFTLQITIKQSCLDTKQVVKLREI